MAHVPNKVCEREQARVRVGETVWVYEGVSESEGGGVSVGDGRH